MDSAVRHRFSTAVAFLMTAVLLLRAAAAQPPDPPEGNSEPDQVPETQWTQLRHEVFTDRQAELQLDRAQALFDGGKYTDAFDILQKNILGDPQELLVQQGNLSRAEPDSFYWLGRRLRSVRGQAIELLESAPPSAIRDYEKVWGPVANSALQQARRANSLPLLMEVARRCYPTLAGARAVDLSATRLLDAGQPALAAAMWERLINSPLHNQRLYAGLFRKAAVAWLLSDEPERAEEIAAQGKERGYSFALADIREADDQRQYTRQQQARNEWLLPFGNRSHNATAQGTIPYLKPVWSKSLAGLREYDDLEQWENSQFHSELAVIGAAIWPIIANDQLIVRDIDGIRACDPQTGNTLWRFNSTLSTRELVRRFRITSFASTTERAIEHAWTKAPELGCITSDGQRVFAIDWTDMGIEEANGTSQFYRRHTGANRVVCLPIGASDPSTKNNGDPTIVEPLWTAGGTRSNPRNDPLSGYFFLGPPVPLADAVFVIAESLTEQELSLVKLEATTGRVMWVQQLGLVERDIFDSGQKYRFNPVCVPVCSGSTIVCPTEARYVVAVDASTGELLWMYDYADRATDFRTRSRSLSREQGYGGLPSLTHIQGNSLLLMPRRSEYIHCVDLKTGRRVWRAKREADLYIGAVSETIVATVSKGGMRGLALRDGDVLWNTRLGLPSGRGVRTQLRPASDPTVAPKDTYLVPLKRGAVAAVELETGNIISSTTATSITDRRYRREQQGDDSDLRSLREIDLQTFGLGSERPTSESRPGNLLVLDGKVFSAGPQHITAFHQVGDLLVQLRDNSVRATSARLLELARVELAAGDVVTAEQRLSQAIAAGGPPAEQARWLLQELFRDRLTARDSQLTAQARREIIDRLVREARTPTEREQALIHLARWELKHGSPARAVPRISTIARLGQNSFVSLDSFSERIVTSDAWGRGQVALALRQSTQDERQIVLQQIEADRRRALATGTVDSLEQFVSVYAATPQAEPMRNRLADRLIRRGEYQSAELLLLQNRRSKSVETRAVTEALLACLWDRLGITIEAGQTLHTLATQYAAASLRPLVDDQLLSVTSSINRPVGDVNSFLRAFDHSSLSWKVFRDQQPLAWHVHTVGITNEAMAGSNPNTSRVWRESPRKVDMPAEVGFDIVRTGGSLTVPHRWVFIDRYSGAGRAHIEMPEQTPLPVARYRYVGHLMPIGGRTDLRAVSLLESGDGAPFWKHRFRPVEATIRDAIEPSVATPSVFVFQTVKHLIGIEPRTGRVLWRRSDLDLESGVRVDNEAGLFGDDEALTLFHSDGETYSILSTQTGETLDTRQASIDFSYRKRVFGRKLFHVTEELATESGETERRIRVWDPVTNQFDLDAPIVGRLNFASTRSFNEMALLMGDRLLVYRMPEMQQIANLELNSSDLARMTTLRMFADDEYVYINLQERTSGLSTGNRNYYLAGESSIPLDNMFKGTLMSISKATGQILWTRPVQPRSVLNMTQCSLPFLIGLSRISPRSKNTRRALELELIDRETGETVGHADRLIPDRIVHARVDRDRGLLTLHGLTSRIDLDFSRRRQAVLVEPGPL